MATEFHAFAAGAWRKAKALHYNEAGLWRTLKEAWRNVGGGVWVKVYSAASFVANFGTISANEDQIGGTTATCFITVLANGSITGTAAATRLYYSPVTAGIGTGYEVLMTCTVGIPPVGAGSWRALTADRAFSLSVSSQSTLTSAGTITIRRIADQVVVSSGIYEMSVTLEF